MNYLFLSSVIGLIVAITITSIFHLHSNRENAVILGSKTSTVIEATIMSIFVFFTVIMIWFSISVRDLKYPRENKLRFTIEVILSGFLPSLFIFLLYYLRGIPITKITVGGFIFLSIKLCFFHVLSQFSGLYSTFLR
jgi:hypothetical protein